MAEDTDEQINPAEYTQALGSIRKAKNWFFLLIGLTILLQLAAFIGVQFFSVLDRCEAVTGVAKPAPAAVAATMPSPATSTESITASEWWYSLLGGLLPGTQLLALVMAVLLVLTLLLAVMVSLVGRLGGADGMIGAFFWSLILLVVLIPWQEILQMRLACGALFNLDELIAAAKGIKKAWGAEEAVAMSRYILYYARFLGYPLVALLIWLSTQSRFGYGYRTMRARQAEMNQ